MKSMAFGVGISIGAIKLQHMLTFEIDKKVNWLISVEELKLKCPKL